MAFRILVLMSCIAPTVDSKRISSVEHGPAALERERPAWHIPSEGEVHTPGGPLPRGKSSSFPGGICDRKIRGYFHQHIFEAERTYFASGSFGKVYKAKACKYFPPVGDVRWSPEKKVVKQIKYKKCAVRGSDREESCTAQRYGFNPVEILPMQLKLPFVADLEAVFYELDADIEGNNMVSLLTRFYAGGNLEGHLEDSPAKDLAVIKDWGAQVAYGLWMLHRKGFVWRDLKPENIMVVNPKRQAPKTLVLTDFGQASSGFTLNSDTQGSELYMAPNVLGVQARSYYADAGDDVYSGPEADWWAHGVFLSKLAGHLPFADESDRMRIHDQITAHNMTLDHLKAEPMRELLTYLTQLFSLEYYSALATGPMRKLMSEDDASKHPILHDPFWHNETDAGRINAYWQNICQKYSLQDCSTPPQPHAFCPDCDDTIREERERDECFEKCNIGQDKLESVCEQIWNNGALDSDNTVCRPFKVKNLAGKMFKRRPCCECLMQQKAEDRPIRQCEITNYAIHD